MRVSNVDIRAYKAADQEQVVELWRRCNLVVPWNDPYHDIWLKLQVQPDLFLVGSMANDVVASVMAGYDGHRGWLNYLAVLPEMQHRGIGRMLVMEATTRLRALGCPKINLQVRSTNADVIAFYTRLGFKVDDVVSMGMRL
jgi:ribosomal protein S18 acetylase RimI-like enzyme